MESKTDEVKKNKIISQFSKKNYCIFFIIVIIIFIILHSL